MLLFGSINPAGGGTTANLWQLTGAAPNTIELNTINGATGIEAPLPAAANFKLLLNNSMPLTNGNGGGVVYEDSNIIIGLGVAEVNPNDIATTFYFYDKITGAVSSKGLGNSGNPSFEFNENGAVKFSGRLSDPLSITDEVADSSTLNGTQRNQSETASSTRIINAGNAVFERLTDSTGETLTDGTNVVFKVETTGAIQTNQAQPHDNTINTLTYDLPIYDTTGTLLGYIKVFT